MDHSTNGEFDRDRKQLELKEIKARTKEDRTFGGFETEKTTENKEQSMLEYKI